MFKKQTIKSGITQLTIVHRPLIIYKLLFTAILILFGCGEKLKVDPSPFQTPEKEMASFQLSPELKLELVASEPMVQDPVAISFDEDGRLWVVEMRGFMPDVEGTGEKEKIGRISVLQDNDGDGKMDTSTIFIDSLILPRALALVKGGALVAENEALWLAQDLDSDLHADAKVLIDPDYAGGPLPEHSGNGLWRGIDNWYYNVKSGFRYHFENARQPDGQGKWIRDSTELRGQWGLSHDDEGRLIYNYNWSQLHADLVPPNYLSRNKNHRPTTGIDHGLTADRRIYPIRSNLAVNRGYVKGTLDERGRLLEFTAACSPFYYRGTALNKGYYGNAFVCEPSGNLIKRNVVRENGYYLSAYDPAPGKEFLASRDERFRPVYLASGPDGALYVVDMYKGLIQHGAYLTDYLREQTLSRKLDKPIHCGRIWRIVPRSWKPPLAPKFSTSTIEELIRQLSHSNGWTRDICQRLLVEKDDNNSIAPLRNAALTNRNPLARLHSLWTLQGLHALDADFLFHAIKDSSVLVRTTAMRLLEPFAYTDKKVRTKLELVLMNNYRSAQPKEVLQITLTAGSLDPEPSVNLLAGIMERYDTSALVRDAVLSSIQNRELDFIQKLFKSAVWGEYEPSKEILTEMLAAAIIRKRDPAGMMWLLTQLEKKPFLWPEKAILTALLTQRNIASAPIAVKIAPGIFSRSNQINPKQLEILASMFEWPGHKTKPNPAKTEKLNTEELNQLSLGRQQYLTTCAGCHGTDGAGLSRFGPTLIGSEWVLGNEKRLALLVLHGLEGPIKVKGRLYNVPEILPVMPAHTPLDDATITNILMYIRNAWGNDAGPIKHNTVGRVRNRAQGRVQPWTVSELELYLRNAKEQE